MPTPNRNKPMSERLFNSPGDGGPSIKHLVQMLKVLCLKNDMLWPDGLNTSDQQAVAGFIRDNFSVPDIDWAHRDRVEFYRKQNTQPDKAPVIDNPVYPPAPVEVPNPDEDLTSKEKREKYKDKFKPSIEDEQYVLRADYDNDIAAQAEILFDMEKKLSGQQKAVENALAISQKSKELVSTGINQLDNRIKLLEINAPTIVQVQHPELEPISLGVTHKEFPLLVKSANARLRDGTRLNFWLFGPAGTGKTYAARSLAQAYFGDNYRSITWNDTITREFRERFNQDWDGHDYNGSLATQFQVFGYMDANGKYVSTAFRRMWEFGGVYLFDEIDGSMPDALLALQGALSSEYASFPDGLVKRHPDCIILAGANTTGLGGGIDYIGAMKQNAAFMNRWVMMEWPHDDALEDALCTDKKWVRRVRHIRKGMARESIRAHLITMRQSQQGEALLAAGVDWASVEKMVLRGSLTDNQWERVSRP